MTQISQVESMTNRSKLSLPAKLTSSNRVKRQKPIVDRMKSQGYEVIEPNAKPEPIVQVVQCEDDQEYLEQRLTNWRKAVFDSPNGNGSGCSTVWATAYVAARNEREKQLAIALEIIKPESNLYRVDVDELDGWVVEAAVRTMAHPDQKQVLRYKHVFHYPNHWIKNKLGINDSAIRMIHGPALRNLRLVLDKLDNPSKIRSYNLHARSVPRPEANAVPVGNGCASGLQSPC